MSMFSNKPGERLTPSENPATVIARGVKVEGEFNSQSDVLIEGEVHGTLATVGMLTVGTEAKIKADIKAGSAIVSGTVEGNLVVTTRLEIKATAKISGDVTSESVSVEAGAVLSGHMNIGTKEAMPSPAFSKRERAQSATVASQD